MLPAQHRFTLKTAAALILQLLSRGVGLQGLAHHSHTDLQAPWEEPGSSTKFLPPGVWPSQDMKWVAGQCCTRREDGVSLSAYALEQGSVICDKAPVHVHEGAQRQ